MLDVTQGRGDVLMLSLCVIKRLGIDIVNAVSYIYNKEMGVAVDRFAT